VKNITFTRAARPSKRKRLKLRVGGYGVRRVGSLKINFRNDRKAEPEESTQAFENEVDAHRDHCRFLHHRCFFSIFFPARDL
jgi:hypothetical protein